MGHVAWVHASGRNMHNVGGDCEAHGVEKRNRQVMHMFEGMFMQVETCVCEGEVCSIMQMG